MFATVASNRARKSYIDTHRFDTIPCGYATGNGNGMNRGQARLSRHFIHRVNFYYCHVYRMLRGCNFNIWPHPIYIYIYIQEKVFFLLSFFVINNNILYYIVYCITKAVSYTLVSDLE